MTIRQAERHDIDTIVRTTAGYGKVAVVDQLQSDLQVSPDHIVYSGDGSSDLHVMMHVNLRDGFTIAVSETKDVAQVAKRSILGSNALSVLIPILEEIIGWQRPAIRDFFESYGFSIQEWESVRTDWLTLKPLAEESADSDPGTAQSARAT